MEEHSRHRRQLLGGMAAAGAAGALMSMAPRAAGAAQAAVPNVGEGQKPTLTTVNDKVVYVTGGSSGIGLGIAQVMHDAGAKVVIGNLDDR
jgi:NADPH:quinone reductase-like Zn-dependent oxidoreductase